MEAKLVVAGIDVHKKMLAVVVVDDDNPQQVVDRRKFGSGAKELLHLRAWLGEHGVNEVVMESTARYWRPVWLALDRLCAAPGASAIQCGAARAQIGFRGRAAVGEAVSGGGIAIELRAGCRAAELAWLVAEQASEAAAPGAVAEPDRSAAGREPDQTVEHGDRFCWG